MCRGTGRLWATAGFILERASGSLAQKSAQQDEWDCGQRRMNQALVHYPFQNLALQVIEFALSGRNSIHPKDRVIYRRNDKEGKGNGKIKETFKFPFFVSQDPSRSLLECYHGSSHCGVMG